MPKDTQSKPIARALAEREEFLGLLAVVALLAFGINLLSSAAIPLLERTWFPPAYIGAVAVAIALGYAAVRVLKARRIQIGIKTVVPFDAEKKQLVPIPGYKISVDLGRVLRAVFLENEALQRAWESDPLKRPKRISKSQPRDDEHGPSERATDSQPAGEGTNWVAIYCKKMDEEDRKQPKSAALLGEALEFCVLDELSTHLSGYFGQEPNEKHLIKEFTRDDVPQLLLQNRVLSILCTPLEDRAVFAKAFSKHDPTDPQRGVLYSLFGADGFMYSRFDLILPSGTVVSRPHPGTLRLESPRLRLEIAISYGGFLTNFPPRFEEEYLGRESDEVIPLKVDVAVTAHLKASAFLRFHGWKYYGWVDSFFDRLQNALDFEHYIEVIGWTFAGTCSRVVWQAQVRRERRGQDAKDSLVAPTPASHESPKPAE
jgi:hypothetical protein